MARLRALGIVALVAGGLLALHGGLAAQTEGPAPSDRAVWAGNLEGFFKVVATPPYDTLELAPPGQYEWSVAGVALDLPRRVVWGIGYLGEAEIPDRDVELRAFTMAGLPLRAIALPAGTSLRERSLRVQPSDGSLWFSDGQGVWRYSPEGQALLTFGASGGSVRGLDLDPGRGRVWVGTRTQLHAYNLETGQLVQTIDLALPKQGQTYQSHLNAIAVDPSTGHVWVTLSTMVRRYSAVGVKELEAPLPAASGLDAWMTGLVLDGTGGAWISGPRRLVRVTGAGQVVVDLIDPFGVSGDEIGAIAADPLDPSVWVAASYAYPAPLRRFDATGQFLAEIPLWYAVAFLVAIEEGAPVLAFTAPPDGTAVPSATPRLELAYVHSGAGIDPQTLRLTTNDQPLAASCDFTPEGAACTPNAAFPEGANQVAATVSDIDGRVSTPATVAFTVDTVAPTITVSAPADGLVTNQPELVIQGDVNELVTLIVKRNGEVVETFGLSSAGTFRTSPVLLTEGSMNRPGFPGDPGG